VRTNPAGGQCDSPDILVQGRFGVMGMGNSLFSSIDEVKTTSPLFGSVEFTGQPGAEPIDPDWHYRGTSWRLIGSGKRLGYNEGVMARGNLNAAPQGFGMPAAREYLPDVRTLYCPGAAEMPSGYLYRWHEDGAGPANLRDWKTAGGFDAETLMYGEWDSVRRQDHAVVRGSCTPRGPKDLSAGTTNC